VRVFQQQDWPGDAALAVVSQPGLRPAEPAAAAGTRRALLRSALALCCSGEVLAEFDQIMGPLPADQKEPYAIAAEIYGSTRMLLAVLPRENLAAVCSGCGCDMWDVLAPLRAVRPVNGGTGSDAELVLDLRMLYLDINAE